MAEHIATVVEHIAEGEGKGFQASLTVLRQSVHGFHKQRKPVAGADICIPIIGMDVGLTDQDVGIKVRTQRTGAKGLRIF
jgi:hypothetical protein